MKTVINVKTDKVTKERAQRLAKEIGLPLSTVVNAYLKQFLVEKEVRFAAPRRMSKKLERTLAKVEKDIKTGRNISPVFSSAEEIDAYLDGE